MTEQSPIPMSSPDITDAQRAGVADQRRIGSLPWAFRIRGLQGVQ